MESVRDVLVLRGEQLGLLGQVLLDGVEDPRARELRALREVGGAQRRFGGALADGLLVSEGRGLDHLDAAGVGGGLVLFDFVSVDDQLRERGLQASLDVFDLLVDARGRLNQLLPFAILHRG